MSHEIFDLHRVKIELPLVTEKQIQQIQKFIDSLNTGYELNIFWNKNHKRKK